MPAWECAANATVAKSAHRGRTQQVVSCGTAQRVRMLRSNFGLAVSSHHGHDKPATHSSTTCRELHALMSTNSARMNMLTSVIAAYCDYERIMARRCQPGRGVLMIGSQALQSVGMTSQSRKNPRHQRIVERPGASPGKNYYHVSQEIQLVGSASGV